MSASFHFTTTQVPVGPVGGWKRFRRGDCPVCSGAAKGCRQNRATEDIFCRSRLNVGHNGWGWVGDDKHGFGIYRDQDQTPEQQRAAALARAEQQRRNQEKRAGLLANQERDRHYRRIARHSGLGTASRVELKRRGLTDTQIDFAHEQGWVSDWRRRSCGGLGLNTGIAGVHPQSGALTGFDGLAIYASDLGGNLTGAQVRPDSGYVRDEFGKYLWVSSASKGGNGPQLRSGNLPLFVFKHPEFNPALPCQVEATEGSLKPLIHALWLWDQGKTQTIVVGAASGYFAGLSEVLTKLSKLESFTLHADAGTQDNPDFRRKYPQALAQVPQGIDAAIGWWGQLNKKQHRDIDELTSEQRTQIQRISVLEWLSFGSVSTTVEERARRVNKTIKLPTDQTAVQRTIERMCRNALLEQQPSAPAIPSSGAIVPNNDCTDIVLWKPPIDPMGRLTVTEQTVPTFAQWQMLDKPRLHIQGNPVPVLLKLVELGYETVLLDDIVGGGKTHTVGEFLQAWQDEQQWRPASKRQRAIYYAADYKNPSTQTLEKIPETPTGGALNLDPDHLTPSGQPHRKRSPKGTKNPDIKALCIEDENVQSARAKGVDLYRGTNSPLCNNCSVGTKNCPYLRAMAQIQEESAVRSHLSKGGSGRVAFVDEAGQTLQSTRTVTAKPADLDGEMAWLDTYRPDVYQSVEAIAKRFKQSLDRAVAERGHYGLTHVELLTFLPSRDELERLFWEAVGDALLKRSDSPWDWPSLEAIAHHLMGTLQPNPNYLFKGASTTLKAEQIENEITPAVLPRLIKIIMGSPGNVSISPTGMLTFTDRSHRHPRTLSNFDTVFLMDATPDPIDLARRLGIQHQDLTRVSWTAPTFKNLTLKIVDGIGKATQQRRNEGQYSEQRRINCLVKALTAQGLEHDQLTGLLDLKAHIENYSDIPIIRGHQFAHSRGSNEFKDCNQLIVVAGNAKENLSSALAQWHILTGEAATIETASPAFWAWVERRARANLLQGNGRTRAQHRPDQPITHYIVGEVSQADIEALQRYFTGCTLERVHAYDLCPEAADQGTQSDRAICKAMWAATERGEEATITQIAEATGMTKGAISKRISNLLETKGYRAFRQSFQLLYKALYSDWKLEDLDEQHRWLAESYLPGLAQELRQRQSLPAEVAADVLDVLEILDGDAVNVLAACDSTTLAVLLSAIVQALPKEDTQPLASLACLRRCGS